MTCRARHFLFAFLFTAAALTAQVVHVGTYGHPFSGWIRATTDFEPAAEAGVLTHPRAGTAIYVMGRRVGRDARIVDIRCDLNAGQLPSFDLSTATPFEFVRGDPPADPEAFFGRITVAGVRLPFVSAVPDGAGYLAHFRGRVTAMLCANVWLWWYPDWPALAFGEVVLCASNGSITDMEARAPADCRLAFGAADVFVPGLPGGAPLLPEGEVLADGQAKSWPLTLVWRDHLASASEWLSAHAVVTNGVCANGISRLWWSGNPRELRPAALDWTKQHWSTSLQNLHTWQTGVLGVAAFSGRTGAQEDQIFVGAECADLPAGLGAEKVRYWVALGQSRWPCQHLEADGRLLDLDGHPNLVMYAGRAHFHYGVSPDQLGKPRPQNGLIEAHGWMGPDRQHWLLNTLSISYRLRGSPALQWQLEAQARLFLFGETVRPGLSTSHFEASRALGWISLVALQLWDGLDNRELAQRVRDRYRALVEQIYIPELRGRDGVWDRLDERQLSSVTQWPINWMPYQQGVGTYWLDVACERFEIPAGRAIALEGALTQLEHGFIRQPDGSWGTVAYRGVDPSTSPITLAPLVQDAGANLAGRGSVHVWSTLCPATVLRHDPEHPKASELFEQIVRDGEASSSGRHWVPPGMGQ